MIQFAIFGIGIFTQDDVAWIRMRPGLSANQHNNNNTFSASGVEKRVLIFDIVCLWGQLFFY